MTCPTRPLLSVAALLLLAGCASTEGQLRARFSKAHSCPEDQVKVSAEGGVVYRASGCGASTEYACGGIASMGQSACEERGLPNRAQPDVLPRPATRQAPVPPGGRDSEQ